jgi:hypothetical protein
MPSPDPHIEREPDDRYDGPPPRCARCGRGRLRANLTTTPEGLACPACLAAEAEQAMRHQTPIRHERS